MTVTAQQAGTGASEGDDTSTHQIAAEILEYLCVAGANPNLADDAGFTPLMWAANVGCTMCINSLVKNEKCGVDVDRRGTQGNTAMMGAAQEGHAGAISALADAGAEVNAIDTAYGWTALHQAVYFGHLSAAHRLLDLGASCELEGREGHLPTDLVTANEEGDPTQQ